ncbi:hypothetical protein F4821DRAFT_277494 [Hypoxylon rubiginosum]|uniref:Uncharacterized protein n=1 Tax=Hypoxylon rubiginosum TaxID=110542 RepID=A0ACC0D5I5_9PEZI|nr:hypothetical protein F4821DRAFT_277494 [Hypoxylon rubiginosum]
MSSIIGLTFDGPIQTVRRRQYCKDSEGNERTRRINLDGTYTAWELVEHRPEPEACSADSSSSSSSHLYVVQENQAPGEPLHWSFFVGSEGGIGAAYQVTGDATCMHYQHAENVNVWIMESYRTSYQICELYKSGRIWVDRYANSVSPPRAQTRREVTENCQGWVVRVLRELQSVGVVTEESVNAIEKMVEPII